MIMEIKNENITTSNSVDTGNTGVQPAASIEPAPAETAPAETAKWYDEPSLKKFSPTAGETENDAVSKLSKAYLEAEKLLSTRMQAPDKYSINRDKYTLDGTEYSNCLSDDEVASVEAFGKSLGLSNEQCQKYYGLMNAARSQAVADAEKKSAEVSDMLAKTFGQNKSDQWNNSMANIGSGLAFCKSLSSDIDKEKLMKEVQALANSGNLEVVKAFKALGCELSDKTKPQKQAGLYGSVNSSDSGDLESLTNEQLNAELNRLKQSAGTPQTTSRVKAIGNILRKRIGVL